jgi:predicted restriction endonuclease
MKVVAPGDVVFCYWETAIRAHGTIRSHGYDAPKPDEFGEAGRNWSQIGYRADVDYWQLEIALRPKDEWLEIQPLLPGKYSPLHAVTGKGLQSVYLAALPTALGELIQQLLTARGNTVRVADTIAVSFKSQEQTERERWEQHEIQSLVAAEIGETEREAIIRARKGQGRFRENIATVERACRITGVTTTAYLIASHIKPWRHAANVERLSKNNGLLLAPQADFLFDRGFISFREGRVIVSDVADEGTLLKLGVDSARPKDVGSFNAQQEEYLEFHRREIFRQVS